MMMLMLMLMLMMMMMMMMIMIMIMMIMILIFRICKTLNSSSLLGEVDRSNDTSAASELGSGEPVGGSSRESAECNCGILTC